MTDQEKDTTILAQKKFLTKKLHLKVESSIYNRP